jgi:hypothetical protein
VGACGEVRKEVSDESTDDIYTLYQWNGESTSGHIIAYLYDDFFYIEDWSMGPLCEEVWGRDDHELDVGVDEVGAKAILLNNGIEPGEKPLTTLFEFVREKYCGCDNAATLFRELAEKAEVQAITACF